MKSEEWLSLVLGIIAILLLGAFSGAALRGNKVNKRWQNEITEKGYGGFNRASGEWEWNK